MAPQRAPSSGPTKNTQQFAKGCQLPSMNPVLSCSPMATAGFRHPPVWMAKWRLKNRATAMMSQHRKLLGVKLVWSWMTIRMVHTKMKVPMN